MDFAQLFEAIRSPALQAVAMHWHRARGAHALPSWPQLRPSEMAAQLNIIWAYRYDPQARSFVGRLAGDRITRGFGRSFRGVHIEDLHPPKTLPGVMAVMLRVVDEPAIYHSSGMLFRKGSRGGFGERIILPLATRGVVDGVIGASDYQTPQGLDADAPVELKADAECWHPIAAPESTPLSA